MPARMQLSYGWDGVLRPAAAPPEPAAGPPGCASCAASARLPRSAMPHSVSGSSGKAAVIGSFCSAVVRMADCSLHLDFNCDVPLPVQVCARG